MSQPNIILIITDQQRFDTIQAHGYPFMDTPALDRLTREGATFTHAFTAGASCVPSRASLFTGQFPHTLGVLRNSDAWRHSWVEKLDAAGYHCVNIGKMHTVPFDAPCGFHERYIVENKERRSDFGGRQYLDLLDIVMSTHDASRPYIGATRSTPLDFRARSDFGEAMGAFEWPLAPELHSDFFVGNLARWWLREHRRRRTSTKPLFLQIGFPGPHPPYDPLPEYLDRYRNKELPLPDVSDEDLASQPRAFKQLRERMVSHRPDSIAHQLKPSREAAHRQRAAYYANVTMIDTKVGEILQTLEEEGYLQDAVVVFTSDHGDVLSEHGQCTKWTMYEPSIRVPLIFWGQGVQRDLKLDSLVQLMDVGPTLLELAGVAKPAGMEAISLLGALRGEPFDGREHVYCEHGRDFILDGTSLVTMVRSGQWKLVHFVDAEDGQLFDLARDPGEYKNLWNESHARPARDALLGELFRWRMEGSVLAREWAAEIR